MKLILVNQRYGHTRTIVIRGWMKGLLSVCLLGAPLALACLGYELAVADANPNTVLSQNRVAADEFIQSHGDACPDCMAYVLFDDDIEQAGNHPCFNDLCTPLALSAQAGLHLASIAWAPAYSATTLALYSHGRPIDPARYSHTALH
jgi:hypothetical protein